MFLLLIVTFQPFNVCTKNRFQSFLPGYNRVGSDCVYRRIGAMVFVGIAHVLFAIGMPYPVRQFCYRTYTPNCSHPHTHPIKTKINRNGLNLYCDENISVC
jgi:hypothetical protein